MNQWGGGIECWGGGILANFHRDQAVGHPKWWLVKPQDTINSGLGIIYCIYKKVICPEIWPIKGKVSISLTGLDRNTPQLFCWKNVFIGMHVFFCTDFFWKPKIPFPLPKKSRDIAPGTARWESRFTILPWWSFLKGFLEDERGIPSLKLAKTPLKIGRDPIGK